MSWQNENFHLSFFVMYHIIELPRLRLMPVEPSRSRRLLRSCGAPPGSLGPGTEAENNLTKCSSLLINFHYMVHYYFTWYNFLNGKQCCTCSSNNQSATDDDCHFWVLFYQSFLLFKRYFTQTNYYKSLGLSPNNSSRRTVNSNFMDYFDPGM